MVIGGATVVWLVILCNELVIQLILEGHYCFNLTLFVDMACVWFLLRALSPDIKDLLASVLRWRLDIEGLNCA